MKALDKEGLDYLANKVYDAINSGGSADYIVEEGQNDIWYYRKWASGIAECWGRFISTVTWSKWGNVYQGNPSLQYATYPTGLFSTNPILSIVCYSTDGNSGTMGVEFYQAASTSRTPNFYAIRPDTGSTPASFQAAFDITARGLWKEFTPSVMKQGQSLRTWNFTPASGISMSQNGAVVRNGIAMGTLIINGSFNATANTYKQIGTTTDKPQGDYVLFDCYRGSDALYEGVIRVTSSGSVDLNTVRGITSGTIYLQLVYTLTD